MHLGNLHFSGQVKPTGDTRGNGAFATVPIPRGTYIGEYEGDILTEEQFFNRYPNGVVSPKLSRVPIKQGPSTIICTNMTKGSQARTLRSISLMTAVYHRSLSACTCQTG